LTIKSFPIGERNTSQKYWSLLINDEGGGGGAGELFSVVTVATVDSGRNFVDKSVVSPNNIDAA